MVQWLVRDVGRGTPAYWVRAGVRAGGLDEWLMGDAVGQLAVLELASSARLHGSAAGRVSGPRWFGCARSAVRKTGVSAWH